MTVGREVLSDLLPELGSGYSVGLDPCSKAYVLHCIKQSKSSLSTPVRFSKSGTQWMQRESVLAETKALGFGLFLL